METSRQSRKQQEKQKHQDDFLQLVLENPFALKDSVYADDKEFVQAAVEKSNWAYMYASIELQADQDVVMAAVKNNGFFLNFVPPALKADKEVVLTAVNNHGEALRYASEALQDDKEIVLASVANYASAVVYASAALRGDKEVVLAAVNQRGHLLMHASEELRADRQVILTAARENGCALEYASRELLDVSIKENLPFVQSVIQASSQFYRNPPCHPKLVVDVVMYFPGLKDVLSSLFRNLQESFVEDNCTGLEPHDFAIQWLARLQETQLCLNRVCRKEGIAVETQRHVREFAGLAMDVEMSKVLQTYSPLFCALLDYWANTDFQFWWALLKYLADEANYGSTRKTQSSTRFQYREST